MRIRPVHLSAALVAVCAAALIWVEWGRQGLDTSDAALVASLPTRGAVTAFVDVQALRVSGVLQLLADSKAAQETDYKTFVEETRFDYTSDLDSILAAFQDGKTSFLLRGRFDWDQLRRHAVGKGATCTNGFCTVETRRPGRYLSFFTLAPNILALAVSDSQWGAYVMKEKRDTGGFQPPKEPAWVSIGADLLREPGALPDGVKAFARSLEGASRATIALASRGDGFRAALTAECASEDQARLVKKQLEEVTELLKKFLARAHQKPNPADISGVLAEGSFEVEGRRVLGGWPIERSFLQRLAEGSL